MKVVILAGGQGTRISEETIVKPKPLIEIGGYPIIWHIMKIYAHFGLTEFVVCCGYKGDMLKRYFTDLLTLSGEIIVDFKLKQLKVIRSQHEPWTITLVDTGADTMTGGRVRRVRHLLDETFCLTYGDNVCDLKVDELVSFHRASGLLATVTAVSQPARFGALEIEQEVRRVSEFREKRPEDGGLINGGFFVLEPGVIDLIDGDDTIWEAEPIQKLVHAGQLGSYVHKGFWRNMDSLRDRMVLEDLWRSDNAPWRMWQA